MLAADPDFANALREIRTTGEMNPDKEALVVIERDVSILCVARDADSGGFATCKGEADEVADAADVGEDIVNNFVRKRNSAPFGVLRRCRHNLSVVPRCCLRRRIQRGSDP